MLGDKCLDVESLYLFLSYLDQDIVEKVKETVYVVHAETGPVVWMWIAGLQQFCPGS